MVALHPFAARSLLVARQLLSARAQAFIFGTSYVLIGHLQNTMDMCYIMRTKQRQRLFIALHLFTARKLLVARQVLSGGILALLLALAGSPCRAGVLQWTLYPFLSLFVDPWLSPGPLFLPRSNSVRHSRTQYVCPYYVGF